MPAGRKPTQSTPETPSGPVGRVGDRGKAQGGGPGREGAGTPFLVASPVFWAAAAGVWIPFAGCENFYQNTTKKPVTITVTIRNKTKNTMFLDVGGKVVARVEAEKTTTLVIEIPAESFLHSDQDGEYLV